MYLDFYATLWNNEGDEHLASWIDPLTMVLSWEREREILAQDHLCKIKWHTQKNVPAVLCSMSAYGEEQYVGGKLGTQGENKVK